MDELTDVIFTIVEALLQQVFDLALAEDLNEIFQVEVDDLGALGRYDPAPADRLVSVLALLLPPE